MIESFFAGYGTGWGGVGGGPEVGSKTVITVTVIATGLGILYLALKKPDPPGYWREAIDGPKPSRLPRTDQVRGWGTYR